MLLERRSVEDLEEVLAIEAGRSLLLDGPALFSQAERLGI